MISYRVLNLESWSDLEILFGNKGACGGCWCMYWRLTNQDYEQNKGTHNKENFYNLVKQKNPLGILAYNDNLPIGWCSVSPRKSLVRLENSRLFKSKEGKSVWCITCLFIQKKYRNHGLSTQLILEASKFAFAKGALVIEAYPIIPKNNNMPSVFAWVGFLNAYLKAGFSKISQPSKSRAIVRLVD